jgi:hypothetical protein
MTSEMNVLLDRLQEAIDEAISDSGRINDIVAEMQKSGYDLCLIVESSAAISPIAGVSQTEDAQPPADFVPERPLLSTGEMQLTGEDLTLLREMNISLAA